MPSLSFLDELPEFFLPMLGFLALGVLVVQLIKFLAGLMFRDLRQRFGESPVQAQVEVPFSSIKRGGTKASFRGKIGLSDSHIIFYMGRKPIGVPLSEVKRIERCEKLLNSIRTRYYIIHFNDSNLKSIRFLILDEAKMEELSSVRNLMQDLKRP